MAKVSAGFNGVSAYSTPPDEPDVAMYEIVNFGNKPDHTYHYNMDVEQGMDQQSTNGPLSTKQKLHSLESCILLVCIVIGLAISGVMIWSLHH